MIADARNYAPKIKIQWQLKSQIVKPNSEVTNQWFEKPEKLRIESRGMDKRKVTWKCSQNGVGMAPVANPTLGKSFVSQEYLESEKSRKEYSSLYISSYEQCMPENKPPFYFSLHVLAKSTWSIYWVPKSKSLLKGDTSIWRI